MAIDTTCDRLFVCSGRQVRCSREIFRCSVRCGGSRQPFALAGFSRKKRRRTPSVWRIPLLPANPPGWVAPPRRPTGRRAGQTVPAPTPVPARTSSPRSMPRPGRFRRSHPSSARRARARPRRGRRGGRWGRGGRSGAQRPDDLPFVARGVQRAGGGEIALVHRLGRRSSLPERTGSPALRAYEPGVSTIPMREGAPAGRFRLAGRPQLDSTMSGTPARPAAHGPRQRRDEPAFALDQSL